MNRLRDAYAVPEPLDDSDPPGGDEAEGVVNRDAVAGALAALPAREREVLLLFYLEDLPLDACAQICAVPVGTVKSRLNRGLLDASRRTGTEGVRGMTPEEILARLDGPLSLRRRVGYLAVGLAGLTGSALIALLRATEPGLPPRTNAAFAVLVAVGSAWGSSPAGP